MITHGTCHCSHYVLTLIGSQKSQHAFCLVFATALLLEQALEELLGHFAQFFESCAQLFYLLTMVIGGAMCRIDLSLSRRAL